MPHVEFATLQDIPQLTDLLHVLFGQETDFIPNREKQMRGLKLIIEQPQVGRILVIREGNSIVGMINLLFTISTAEGGAVILLEDLIVGTEHRGKGLGTKLLQAAIVFARENGISRITLLTDGDNAEAIKFYQKHGFQASRMMPLRWHLENLA